MFTITKNKLGQLVLAAVSLGFFVSAQAESAPAGVVIVNTGSVKASGRELSRGSKIFPGDEITTAANSSVQIRFTDTGLVSLGANAVYKVNAYEYKGPQDKEATSTSTLVKGKMLAITGAITKENPKGYTVKSKLATIGVSGTSFASEVAGKVQTVECYTGTVSFEMNNGITIPVGVDAPTQFAMASEDTPAPATFSEIPDLFENLEEVEEDDVTNAYYDSRDINAFYSSFEVGLDEEFDETDLEEGADSIFEEDLHEELDE